MFFSVVSLTTFLYTPYMLSFGHEASGFIKVDWRRGQEMRGKKIAHLIGWMNSSDLWDPSVSCNEFINPSNNDPNQLWGGGKYIGMLCLMQ